MYIAVYSVWSWTGTVICQGILRLLTHYSWDKLQILPHNPEQDGVGMEDE